MSINNFEKILCIPELFENLNKYTNGKSSRNLLFSSNQLYKRYIIDKFTIREIIKKFLLELRLTQIISIHPTFNSFSNSELRRYYLDWVSIHSYFIHFNFNVFELTDILVHLVDRNKKYMTSEHLFEQIIKKITYKEDNYTIFNRNPISYNQYYTIISQCDLKQLIVFFQHTVVSINVIASVIKQMLNKPKIDILKIEHCLKYVLLKTTFGHHSSKTDNYFVNDIVFELIRTNQIELLSSLFQKRNFLKNFFDYQFLVLKAIELDKIEVLQLIQNIQMKNMAPKQVFFITTNVIYDICERGSFHILKWVIEYQLDRLINLGSYINSIYSGIIACESLSRYNLSFLFETSSYFNPASRVKLNEALYVLYNKMKLLTQDQLYFECVF